ncbi:riboflavin biosynthesis protein RibF [Ureaplasma sp. ES3154-GEN]|uniref:riboflavin biosynthesis protein RibF n=1 Tax=Ureaplasma sp. ES3154-GEN TaxID=2984844 RepID=UPI0021E6EFBE|nr:riboflavin biosynthesis protein RibF [Ureaplasma sp. ES3154-GEN]MCV3743275.1 riboflavin biosynthesis protein RibF [Ureaplasma sp. ES3154-GEN]
MIIELKPQQINNLVMDSGVDLIIGFFDGLHHGHMKLFAESKKFSILTFKNIPRKTASLYPFEKRIEMLEQLPGLVDIYVFDIKEYNIDAQNFIDLYLKKLAPERIVIGQNFSFGSDQQPSSFLKQSYPNTLIIEAPLNSVSTSLIKTGIATNNWDYVNQKLVNPYTRCGLVVHGDQVASNLGFATANIHCDPNLIRLVDGVYITSAIVNNKTYKAITYIGVPKTIVSRDYSFIETHIIDFHQNIYNQNLTIIFHDYIAPNKKFNSIDELINTITSYVQIAKNAKY